MNAKFLTTSFSALVAVALLVPGCSTPRETGTYETRGHVRGTVEVPLFVAGGTPFVQVRANGSGPFWFVVDTGAEIDVVHSRVAAELGLRRIDTLWLNETVEGDWCSGLTVEIGNARYHPERVGASTALSDFEKEHPLDGVLGQSFFRLFVVELDYPRQVLRIHNARRFRREGEFLPLEFVGFQPLIRGTVEFGSLPPVQGTFEVDTGSAFALELASHFLERHGFDDSSLETKPFEYRMVQGKISTRAVRGVRLEVGSVSVAEPVIRLGGYSDRSDSWDGTIGNEFFRNFHVIIDYPRKRLFLEDPKNSIEETEPAADKEPHSPGQESLSDFGQ